MHGTYNIKNYKIQIKYSCTLISQHGQICKQSLGTGYGSCRKHGHVGGSSWKYCSELSQSNIQKVQFMNFEASNLLYSI